MKKDEFKKIIEFAVDNEVEAYEFYRDAAAKVKDQNLKGVFQELAEEELGHQKFLKGFLTNDVASLELNEVSDYKIAETIDKPKLSVDMSFADAFGLAIKNEEEAMDMYKNLANACIEEEQKKLFLELSKMEKMHKARLEEIYLNVAYAEVW